MFFKGLSLHSHLYYPRPFWLTLVAVVDDEGKVCVSSTEYPYVRERE